MAILTRETNGTGVTNNGAPLTNGELDNNFIELVADIAEKVSTTDLNESVDDRVNTLLQAGNGVDLSYDDPNGELTISSEVTEITAYNGTGATLSKGTVVYQSGVQGTNISVAAASNGSASTMPAVGIVISDIADTATGQIAVAGLVKNLDTSSFTAGDVLYVGTSGALTATKPTGESNLIQNFGRALKINASSGEVLVLGAGRTNDVPNLADGNVFIGNSSNAAEKRALVEADISDFGTYLTAESDTLDSVTGRGATTSNNIQVGNATVTGNLTVQGTTTTLNTATLDVEDKNITINYSTGDSSGSADGAGITIQDAVNSTTDATILWDATGDKFEFSHAVDVAGNITLTGTVDGRDIATDGTKLDGIEAGADVTDATNVAAAGAIMDSDFASNGFMKRTGAGTYTVDASTYLTSVSVDGLSDATITSVADNEVLAYDSTSSEWINQTAAEAGLATSAQGTLADSALQPADLSVTTNAAGTAALTYTSATGVFSYTPPDLSSYLTSYTETDTLDSVTGRGATTTNAVTVGNLTSTGIDDNATSTAITIDSIQRVGLGVATPSRQVHFKSAQSIVGTVESTLANFPATLTFRDAGETLSEGVRIGAEDDSCILQTNGTTRLSITSTGNVGIGTSTAVKNLELGTLDVQRWQTGSTTLDLTPTSGATDQFVFNTSQAAIYDWAMAGTVRMRLESDYDLHVDGDVIAYSTTVSDASLKDDVATIDSALDKVSNLRGVTYTWNKGSREGKRDLGVIAQEVEAVIPEIVHEKNMALIDGETYKTVDYEKLTAVLIEAVKELKAEVDALKAAQ